MVEVVVEGPKVGMTAHQPTQVGAHLDQRECRARRVIDAAEQLLASRFDRAEQPDQFLAGVRSGIARVLPLVEGGPDIARRRRRRPWSRG